MNKGTLATEFVFLLLKKSDKNLDGFVPDWTFSKWRQKSQMFVGVSVFLVFSERGNWRCLAKLIGQRC